MTEKITKDWLFEKYIEEDKTQAEVSELIDLSRSTISTKLQKYNIDKKKYKKYNDKQWLNQKYNKEELTQKEIANILGVNPSVISKHLKKNGLIEREENVCPECENEYLNISRHWASYESHRPEYTEKQKQVMIGLLMSDGWISDRADGRKNRFQCEMVTLEYIKYLKRLFGILCNNITEIDKEKNQDVYRLSWKPHGFIDELANWYSSGRKVWPHMELTPIILKNYYVGDGYLLERGGNYTRPNVKLGMANEYGNELKIKDMFPFSNDDYTIDKRVTSKGYTNMEIRFTVDGTEKFFEYIGEDPLPGFEYKWPGGS